MKQDPNLRLNKEDALNVEVFHTNAESYGFRYPIGDIDFYINGGYKQPQCHGIEEKIVGICSHGMPTELFNAINKNSKKSSNCDAKWKCNPSIFRFSDPEIDRPHDLEDNCSFEKKVTLGDLDSNNRGTYWVEIGKYSDMCYFDLESGIFLLKRNPYYHYFF